MATCVHLWYRYCRRTRAATLTSRAVPAIKKAKPAAVIINNVPFSRTGNPDTAVHQKQAKKGLAEVEVFLGKKMNARLT